MIEFIAGGYPYNVAATEKFNSMPEAFAIHRGRVWVSQLDGWPPEIGDPRNCIVFAGVDRLTLSVPEARALRDWLNKALPVDGSGNHE